MPLTLDENTTHYQIKSYQPGAIKINDHRYLYSLIITPTKLIENWRPQTANGLVKEDFTDIAHLQPAILLIGTGQEHAILPMSLYGELINAGIGVEVMSTGAACRTFNALVAENRNVIAALIIR
jgi:uncharacterized protein